MSLLLKSVKNHPVILVVAPILGVGIVFLFVFDPAQHGFFPVCLFHQVTGFYCPGCGSLRALHQLLHGQFGSAFRFNPLVVLVGGGSVLIGALHVMFKAVGRPAPLSWRPVYLWVLVGLLVVFGVWRNLPASPLALP